MLDQDLDAADFEVIVVNDSGRPLPPAAWQQSRRIRVIDTQRRERSIARNVGAAVARGRYFHFLDDDDVIVPGALRALREQAEASRADWLYGTWQTVDDDGRLVAEFRAHLKGNIFSMLVSGEGLPLQASLLSSSRFFGIGGFHAIPELLGVEDRDLGRRLALTTDIRPVDALIARVRIGEQSSTTDWARIAERDRQGRDLALSAHGAFGRLRASAQSGHWRGRVSRAYLASTAWNMKRGHLATAISRAALGIAAASWWPLTPGYWDGLTTRIS